MIALNSKDALISSLNSTNIAVESDKKELLQINKALEDELQMITSQHLQITEDLSNQLEAVRSDIDIYREVFHLYQIFSFFVISESCEANRNYRSAFLDIT